MVESVFILYLPLLTHWEISQLVFQKILPDAFSCKRQNFMKFEAQSKQQNGLVQVFHKILRENSQIIHQKFAKNEF